MTVKAKKIKALDLIMSRGLFTDEKEARAYLMAGEVYAGTQRVTGAAQMLPADCDIHVKGLAMPYVSKGGFKLDALINGHGYSKL